MNARVKAQPTAAPSTAAPRPPAAPQPYAVPALSETQFVAENVARKTTGSTINGTELLVLFVAFAVIIGGYMVIKESDRRNNIARGKKASASHSKSAGGSFPTLDLDRYTDPPAMTNDDLNSTANKEEQASSTGKAEGDHHGHLRRLAASSKTGHPMGRHPLLCTVGASDLHSKNMIPEDGLCEYMFFTHYYRSSGDTFANDSGNKTRAFLAHASRSSSTTFGISVTYRNITVARHDVAKRHGKIKLQLYSKEKRVYHYGVLDVEYLASRGANTGQLKLAFDLLKDFKSVQSELQQRSDSERAKRRGFVILGVKPGVRADGDVFKELSRHLKSFSIDGLILRTHLFDSEIIRKFRTCLVTPPTSYNKPKSDYLVGMADVVRLYRMHRASSWHHSLMVSFTMALRWYKTANGSHGMGAPCDKKDASSVLITDATHACKQVPNLFTSTEVDNHTRTVIALGVAGKAGTYDDGNTIIHKICALFVDFPDVATGAAIFDADFQDWSRSCNRRGQEKVKGSRRLQGIRNRYHEIFSSSRHMGAGCSDT